MDRCRTIPDLVNGLGDRSCRKTRCVYRRPSILRRARLTLWQRNRFFFTLLPSLVLGANTLFAQAPTSSAVEHPNVLFIAIDDLRPALGCYGDAPIRDHSVTESLDNFRYKQMRTVSNLQERR